MKVAISGVTGFVGQHLKHTFLERGFEVCEIKREDYAQNRLLEKLDGCDTVINLAGAPILKRWSKAYKQVLYDSRVETTKALVSAMKQTKPKLFISTSAVGIYTPEGKHTEEGGTLDNTFLATICKDWESAALEADTEGIRTIIFRFGVVLGREGGALAQMLLPFSLGLGGRIGSGSQFLSWVHIQDLIDAYCYAMAKEEVKGVYNLVSPEAVTNHCFTKALGSILNRPTILPVPAFALRLLFGEGASILTHSQHAYPKRLLDDLFTFKYDNIELALDNLLKE